MSQDDKSKKIDRKAQNREFAIKTVEMLDPILKKKQFELVGLTLKKKTNKISIEEFEQNSSSLEDQIFKLQKRIVREIDIIGNKG
jgi:hypothetical protein